MGVIEKIEEILEDLSYEFDYILSTREKVMVVRAFSSYNRILFEAKDLLALLSILEKESEKSERIWCRDS